MKNVIDFEQIDEHGPQEYSAAFEISAAELGRDELAGIGPVTIEGEAEAGDAEAEYVADGEVRYTADYTCSRCLEPYPIANVSSYHVRFRPRPASVTEGEEVEITEEEELNVEFYSERAVPLRDLAVEQVQLSIPMKPLCDENCLGLCPGCGANRNREQCRCETAPADDRWAALEQIREQLNKKKEI